MADKFFNALPILSSSDITLNTLIVITSGGQTKTISVEDLIAYIGS